MKIVALLLSLLCALPASAGCLADGGTLLKSLDCTALPTIDKYYQPKTFPWGHGPMETEILSVNRGNELSFWKLGNPAAPQVIPGTNFRVGNQGDSDHDLTSYSLCDWCRYGVASYKRAIVVFDMGTGAIPSIGSKFTKYNSTNPRLAFTYKSGGEQYIISKDLPGALMKVQIYRIVDHNNVVKVREFQRPPGSVFQMPVSGGFDFGTNIMLNIGGTFYMYHKDGDNLIFVRDTGVKSSMGFYDSAAVVGNRMVTAENTTTSAGLKLWDLTNPSYPTLLFTYPGKHMAVGFNGRHVITSGPQGEIRTFGVTGNTLVPMDWQFWDPSHPWNDWPVHCTTFLGATFSYNGNWSYVARFSVFQRINFTDCGSQPPTPTPTPPPWPTPFPTCVPGCLSPVDQPSQPE